MKGAKRYLERIVQRWKGKTMKVQQWQVNLVPNKFVKMITNCKFGWKKYLHPVSSWIIAISSSWSIREDRLPMVSFKWGSVDDTNDVD